MFNYSTPSGLKTASAQIIVGPGALSGLDGTAPTSSDVTVTLYDSEDSNVSGKLVLAIIELDAGMVSVNHEFFSPVAVNRGIYASVAGAGTGYSYNVRYIRS